MVETRADAATDTRGRKRGVFSAGGLRKFLRPQCESMNGSVVVNENVNTFCEAKCASKRVRQKSATPVSNSLPTARLLDVQVLWQSSSPLGTAAEIITGAFVAATANSNSRLLPQKASSAFCSSAVRVAKRAV